MINLYALSNILTAITSFSIAIFVLVMGYRTKICRIWGIFAICVAIYGFGAYRASSAPNYDSAFFWWQISYVGVIMLPALFLHFVYTFLDDTKHIVLLRIVYFITLVILAADIFSKELFVGHVSLLFQNSAFFKPGWWIYPPGPLHIFYTLVFYVGLLIYAHIKLIRAYEKSSSLKRQQIKYFFIATVLGFVGGGTSYLPCFNINIYPVFNITVAIYPLIMTYAIMRYQLMDIEVIIKRTLVFTGLFTSVFVIVGIVTFVLQNLLGRFVPISNQVSVVISIIILIILYDPIKSFLVNITNKYLFQKKYDPRQVIGSFIDYAATVLDSDKIVNETIELLETTFHPEFSDILLPHNDSYISHNAKNNPNMADIGNNAVIVTALKAAKDILSTENKNDKRVTQEINNEILNFKAVLAVPLMLQDELIGMIFLGKKKSDEYYTQEDLKILLNLAHTLAIALKNAEFVKERDVMHLEMTRAKLKEELATMAYGMSHQFNNKFQGIAWTIKNAEMVLSKANIPSDIKTNIQSVFSDMAQAEKDALGAGEIAQGLLNFTKPDRLQYDMVNVASNIDIVFQLVEYKHPAFKEVEVIKHIEENLPLTYAHLGYLQEAYFIVLDNAYEAVEYMKARNIPNFKGRITVSVSSDKDSEEILVSVKDNGIGMKPDVLENVRKAIPFFTTKGSSGKSGHGAGVNMLSKFIDNFHKGRTAYDSTPDEGTTVNMYIPITEKPKD